MVLAAGVVLLGLLANLGLDYGYSHESCAHCGARSTGYHFVLFGIGGDCYRNVNEGPISRLIQQHDGRPCDHQWELFDGYAGNLTSRVGASGRGLPSYLSVGMLEAYPDLEDVLLERAGRYPDFVTRLRTSIQAGDRTDQVVQDLLEELMNRVEPS